MSLPNKFVVSLAAAGRLDPYFRLDIHQHVITNLLGWRKIIKKRACTDVQTLFFNI